MFPVKKVLMITENRPVLLDQRVWAEATALRECGFEVCLIGPRRTRHDPRYLCLEGIHVYCYHRPNATKTLAAYLLEYTLSIVKTWWLSLYILYKHGFDVIHTAN